MKMWKKLKEIFLKRKLVRVSVMLLLAGVVCLWDNSIYCPSRMPEIVFTVVTFYEGEKELIFFIDNKGDCYYSDNSYVCSLNHAEDNRDLINEYAAGRLRDKIKLCGKCDTKELYSNYRKLYGVSRNRNFYLIPPMWQADGVDIQWRWQENYYDRKRETQSLKFHYEDYLARYKANDERGNEIYEWLVGIMDGLRLRQQEWLFKFY